jgi:DNA-binding response OmpR family regulator
MKRFLLVEDNGLFREGLALLLEWRTGFANAQAGSLAEAGRVLGSLPGTIGVAIVDVELPDGDGIELIEMLRETGPDMPILALTTAQDPYRRSQAFRAGADDVFNVPESIEELVRAACRLGRDWPGRERRASGRGDVLFRPRPR